MSEISETPETPAFTTERRLHPRHRIRTLAYIDLGEDNGGIVLNISEAGLALQAAVTLADEELPRLRIQLPPSKKKVEASGRITWLSPTGKEAGVAFVNLPEDVRAQINEWIVLDSTPGGAPEVETPPAEEKIVEEKEQKAATASEALPAQESFPEPVPPPELVPPVPPEAVPPKREQARSATGPATFGSFGRRKPAVPPEKFAAPAAVPAEAEQSAAFVPPALIVAPAMDAIHGARPLRESAFTLREPAPHIRREVGGKRRWWAFGGAVISLAAISFAAGMLAGRGDLRVIAEIFGRENAAARTSIATNAPTPSNLESTEHSSADGKRTDETASNPDLTPQNQRPASQILTLHRSRPGSFEEGAGRQDSSAMLNLPESPVSASASVAVRTRRSIPLPSETGAANSQTGQNLQIGALISKTDPAYPQDAQDQKIEGTVRLHASIGEDGNVQKVDVLGGPPALAAAASNAVRSWRYAPTLYDGQPVETEEDVIVVFRLPH